MPGEHTYSEIMSQADAWEDALAAFGRLAEQIAAEWEIANPSQIIVIGCGSTYYLAQTAARLLQNATAVPTAAVPSSELLFFTDEICPDPANTLLLAISRSGTTTETLEAVRKFHDCNGSHVWTITCYPESPLAESAGLVLPAVAAQEESIAQTRSFSSMLILAEALAVHLSQSPWQDLTVLPDLARQGLAVSEAQVSALADNWPYDRAYFLGSGSRYGVASEAMLKMLEMSLTPSQTFHFMEFRHGPMSMAGPEAVIIGLLAPETFSYEAQVLQEMSRLGSDVLALNPTSQRVKFGRTLNLPAGLRSAALPVLYLPPLQLLAYYRSLAKGLDPDSPRNLAAVIELDPRALTD